MWLEEPIFQTLYEAFIRTPKSLDYELSEKNCKLYYKALIKTFFVRKDRGLEMANYYVDWPHPVTEKKLKAAEGQCTFHEYQF
jgi:hypothetical protein